MIKVSRIFTHEFMNWKKNKKKKPKKESFKINYRVGKLYLKIIIVRCERA